MSIKVAAVIAEFNPFHSGHAAILAKAREMTNADYVLVLMSGDYCQRGEPAVIEKFTRAHMALANGADLVLELPSFYALGSAEYFAFGAVNILNKLGVADCLVFGSESSDISKLSRIAELLNDEPPAFKLQLQAGLKRGEDFPTARMKALAFCLGENDRESADLLRSANDLLGIEYIRKLLKTKSKIKALTAGRTLGVNSSSIREGLFSQSPFIAKRQLPESAKIMLKKYIDIGTSSYSGDKNMSYELGCFDKIEAGLKHILSLESVSGVSMISDVGNTLARKIYKELPNFTGMDAFIEALHSRDMTRARIKRALMHIFLNMRKKDMDMFLKNETGYARILGFKKSSKPLLTEIKERSKLPLISRLSQSSKILAEDEAAKKMLAEDIKASLIYDQLFLKKASYPLKSEFEKKIVVI